MAYFIYPVLFILLPLIFLYSQNIGEIRFRHILPIGSLLILLATALMYLFHYIFNLPYSFVAPIVSGFIILLYTPTNKFKRFFSKYSYQYIIEYAAYGCILLLAAKSPVFFVILFNIITIFITLLLLINIAIQSAHSKQLKIQDTSEQMNDNLSKINPEDKPDVYNIIFDAYIGIDSLKKTTGFDNSNFYDDLRKRGFKITSKSYSNYNHTAASLPSLMNMNYTENYLADDDFKSKAFIHNNLKYRFSKMIDGIVPQLFKSMGYKYIITGEPLLSDDLLAKFSSFIDDYTDRAQNLIKNGTIIAFFSITILGGLFRTKKDMGRHAEYIKRILALISEIPKKGTPIFAFTHVWAPHTPYVFNADGSINNRFSTLNDLTSEDEETKTAYVGNLRYINTLVLNMLDNLIDEIKKKGRKAIIIIHSDHGLFKSEERSTEYNILFANYTYKIEKKDIFPEDSITLVNVYRYLFNSLFSTNYPILDDKIIYENWFASNHNEEDITNTVKKEIYGDK